ncbi:MAG: hypothetical protein IJY86_03285 [Clostridia bacterium]|nr:hypothetical protein [Clostridia bacterium]
MRLIKYELKKLFSTPVFLVIILVLLAANAVYAEKNTALSYLDAYNAIHEDLDAMTQEEQNRYVAERLSMLNFAFELQRMSEFGEEGSEAMIESVMAGKSEEFIQTTMAAVEDGSITKYFPGNIRSEYYLFEKVSEAMNSTYSYETYVKDIIKRAQIMLITGTVSNDSKFIYNNTSKTLEDFSDFPPVEVKYSVSNGVLAATDTPLTDIFCIVAVAIAGVFVCRTERDDGILAIVMPTAKGRSATAVAKLVTLLMASWAACLLLCATNYGFALFRYGFGDTSRSIQSVHEFASCTSLISVGQFLLLSLIVKLVSAAVWGTVIFVAANAFRRTSLSLLVYLGAFALSAAASALPSGSRLTLLRYANPVSFFDAGSVVGKYINLNFFGAAVGIRPTCIVFGVLIVLGCVFWGIWTFAKMYPSATAKTIRLRTGKLRIRGHSVGFYELKKLFVYRLGIAVLIAAALFQINSADNVYYDTGEDESLFRAYMTKLEGPVDGTQDVFIEEERQRIFSAGDEIAELEQKYAEGLISYKEFATENSRLLSLQKRASAFSMLESYQYSVQESGADTYVYPTGYKMLFNHRTTANTHAMLESIVLIVGLSSLFAGDFESGTVFLLNPLPRGRKYLYRRKLASAALFCVATAVIAFIPDYFTVKDSFSLNFWTASTASLPFLSDIPFQMPIWVFYGVLWAVRIFGALVTAALISAIGCAVKKNGITMIASGAVLLIPLAAEKLFFTSLTPFTLLPLQNGTPEILSVFPSYLFAFILYGAVGLICVLFVRRRFTRETGLIARLAKKLLKKLLRKIFGKPVKKVAINSGR